MSRISVRTSATGVACVLLAIAGVTAVVIQTATEEAEAHGSTQVPASRTYSCRFEQPGNPMCAAAWSANDQALYDWMEVNIGDVAGQHQQRIPDGRLCSAGRDKYAAFDTPGEWPVTHLAPGSSGRHDVVFTNTAPHATAYYRLYLTRDGFDARRDSLAWADLQLVHDSGPLAASPENRFTVSLPARSQPAILYVIWQRSDSPEAFYACSDVTIGTGSGGSSTSTSSTSTSSTSTTSPPSGEFPFSPVAGIEVAATDTRWESGYCRDIRVTNTTNQSLSWEVHDRPAGTITSLWDAKGQEIDHEGHEGHWSFVGESWNARLTGGESTRFGMCVSA